VNKKTHPVHPAKKQNEDNSRKWEGNQRNEFLKLMTIDINQAHPSEISKLNE
jgi:hypothetical protein